jgi:hypothetical protein
MKKIVLLAVAVAMARTAWAQGTTAQSFFKPHLGTQCSPFTDNRTDDGIWSGSWEDVVRVAEQCARENAVAAGTDAGRNVLNLVPYSELEFRKNSEGARAGEPGESWHCFADAYHQGIPGDIITKFVVCRVLESAFGIHPKNKWTMDRGDVGRSEGVYNSRTHSIVVDGNLGTFNKGKGWRHWPEDVWSWEDNPKDDSRKMMYVGIVWKTDERNPNRYYIVDANTGEPLTRKEVREAPLSINRLFEICWENERYREQAMPDEPPEPEEELPAPPDDGGGVSEEMAPDDDAPRPVPQETPETEESPSESPSGEDEVSRETSPEEDDESRPSPQPAPEAVENTPEAVAVAWLRAYNARDIARMEELSTREFVEIWEIGRNDFPDPPENWRKATIEPIETDSHEVISDDPDLEPVEIGVECVCTGADSNTYHGGIVIYRSKSSGLYKVGMALVFPPE